MRIVILFVGLVCWATLTRGQIPEMKNRAMIYKTTATWCYPCGTWGWDLANVLNERLADNIVYLALFNSNDGSFNNSAFYNSTAVELASHFGYSSWPSFGVNGFNFSDPTGNNTAMIYGACDDSVSAFNASPVIANAASSISINSNKEITVTTKSIFFNATEGDYYLATYLVEEGAVNQQHGHSGTVAHKGVLRTAIDALPWGSPIATGTVDSGFTVSKSYTYKVTDDDWDLSKLTICNIIWKKEGSTYRYVNGSKHSQSSTSISAHEAMTLGVNVYPNPADYDLKIEIIGLVHAYALRITDIFGREVWQRACDNIESWTINVSDWDAGLYILQLSSDGIHTQRKFWIK